MPNDYYGLMQSLAQPRLQRQANNKQQMDQMGQYFMQIGQAVVMQQAQKGIDTQIADAEKPGSGKKVSYTIDPKTGMKTPTISSQDYGGIFEALKNPELAAKYEAGLDSKGRPRLIPKKQVKSNLIEGAKSLIAGQGNSLWPQTTIKNPVTGQDEKIDITNEEDVGRVFGYHGIEDWRNNPELIEAGLPGLYDTRIKGYQDQQIKAQAAKEPRVQPYSKGLGRVGSAGAEYKEATAKYGEQKTKQMVDTIVSLQEQGKTLAQIRELLEKAGADANVFLKAYAK